LDLGRALGNVLLVTNILAGHMSNEKIRVYPDFPNG
jgi:hypothetical protein